MAFDKSGKHHFSEKRAQMFNKGFGKPGFGTEHGEPDADDKEKPHMATFDHGDGSGHTEMEDGTRVDHSDMAGYKEHVMKHPDHKRMHAGADCEPGDWKL